MNEIAKRFQIRSVALINTACKPAGQQRWIFISASDRFKTLRALVLSIKQVTEADVPAVLIVDI